MSMEAFRSMSIIIVGKWGIASIEAYGHMASGSYLVWKQKSPSDLKNYLGDCDKSRLIFVETIFFDSQHLYLWT